MTAFWADALLNSIWIVLGVTGVSLLISVPMAWLIERTDLPGARSLGRVLSLPYVVPSYLLAISWITLANPSVGWLKGLGFDIYGLGGIIFVEASALFAIVFLSFRAGLRSLDPALEEAARLGGASPLGVFFRITCPLLKNTIFASLIAVALASLASFAVPAMIGSPARVFVLTTGIFSLLKQGSLAAQSQALVIAVEMGLVALALVLVSRFFMREQASLLSGKSSRPALVRLGKLKPWLAIGAWTVWGLVAALPLVVLLLSSFMPDPGDSSFSGMSLKAWRYVLADLPGFWDAVANSLIVSSVAALLVLLVSIPVALLAWQGRYGKKRRLRALAAFFEDGALLSYSLPGTVIAVLLIFFAARFSFLGLADTLSILVVALVAKYLTLGLRTLGPGALNVHPSLIEAAQLSGAGSVQRLWRIWLPLLKPSIFAALLLVLMPCVAELTMSLLLYGPGTETLGVSVFQLQEYADRASASVVGSLLLFLVLGFQVSAGRLLGEH